MSRKGKSRFAGFGALSEFELWTGRVVLCRLVDGLPAFPFRGAPSGLATARQLAEKGLQSGGQDVYAFLLGQRYGKVAFLYRVDLALPKRRPSPAQLEAMAKARAAALELRRWCPVCQTAGQYCVSTREGRCDECVSAGRVGQYVDVVAQWGAA
jgi:hypothetical protein